VTKLGSSIDELEDNLLGGVARSVGAEGLTKSDGTLLDTWDGTADHNEVFVDNTIADKAAQRSNGLLGKIELSGTIVSSLLSDLVDLVVDLSTMMITVLTGTSDREGNTGWMPSSNTSDLAQTLVSLTGQAASSPTSGDSFEAFTLGNGANVDQFVLLEDGVNANLLLEKLGGEVNLSSNGATVDLDLENVGLLLTEVEDGDLGVGDNSDDLAVLLDAGQLAIDGGSLLLSSVVLGILGEGIFLERYQFL